MEWLVGMAIAGGLVALIAVNKGRSGLAWFFYGAFLFPIAFVHACVMGRDTTPKTVAEAEAATARREAAEREASRRPCPKCAELILPAAAVCPQCRSELPAGWADSRHALSPLPDPAP